MRDVPPKAQRRVGALRRGDVERDERHHRRRTARRIDQPELVTDRVVSDQQCAPSSASRRMSSPGKSASKIDGVAVTAGAAVRTMTDASSSARQKTGDVSGASVWIGQEIATPSAGRDHRSRDRLGLGRCRRRSGSQGCGAGTPRRGRRAPWWRRIDRRRATANPPSTWTLSPLQGITGCLGL